MKKLCAVGRGPKHSQAWLRKKGFDPWEWVEVVEPSKFSNQAQDISLISHLVTDFSRSFTVICTNSNFIHCSVKPWMLQVTKLMQNFITLGSWYTHGNKPHLYKGPLKRFNLSQICDIKTLVGSAVLEMATICIQTYPYCRILENFIFYSIIDQSII